jgi:hypothetical protein
MVATHRIILLGSCYALLMSLAFGLTNPPFQSPDEKAHLAYINYLIKNRSLPNQADPARAVVGEGHQPPLYYAAAACVAGLLNGGDPVKITADNYFEDTRSRSIFFVLRALGALMVAATVCFVGKLALHLEIDPFWPVLVVASLPQFLFIGSSINNDIAVALLSTMTLTYLIACRTDDPIRAILVAGAVAGLALLAKKSGIGLLPSGMLFIWLIGTLRSKIGLYFVAWAAFGGWLIVRNWAVYGDPLGTTIEAQTLSYLVDRRPLFSLYFLTDFPLGLASSFVGNFGWLSVQIPMRIVALYCLSITPPLLLSLRGLSRKPEAILLWSVFIFNVAGLVYYNLTYTQSQGRLLFASIGAFACLVGIGMSRLLARSNKIVAVKTIAATACVTLDVYALVLNISHYR